MGQLTENMLYTHPEEKDADFPDAPHGWAMQEAKKQAATLGVPLTDDHWEVVRSLQAYFSTHEFPNRRELSDALDEKYHHQGGRRFLYTLFPSGPVSQGCQLAGVEMPAGSIDRSFGSSV